MLFYACCLILLCSSSLISGQNETSPMQVTTTGPATAATTTPPANLAPEYQLVQYLVDKYPLADGGRPVRDLGTVLLVQLTYELIHLNEINDVDQTISLLATLRVEWQDPFLVWKNEPKWVHMPQVSLLPSAIWTPRILHYNNVADQQVVSRFGALSEIIVKSNGQAIWKPTGIFTSNCKLNLNKFPFDKQSCNITFESWLRNTFVAFANATIDENFNGPKVFGQGSVWEFDSIASMVDPTPFNHAIFTIAMHRNIQYFLYNIIIPCILLSILQMATFCLNPESADRPAFSVSVLVAFGIFQIMIQEQIPKTSELIFLLLYIVIQFAIGTVSTIISTIMCYVIATRVSLRGPGAREVKEKDADGNEITVTVNVTEEEADEHAASVLRKVRIFDLTAFIMLAAATGVSHGVIFAYIAA